MEIAHSQNKMAENMHYHSKGMDGDMVGKY